MSDDLMTQVTALKDKANKKIDELNANKVKKATIQNKFDELAAALESLSPGTDLADLQTALGKAAETAQQAVQTLTDALEEGGVEV